ncbi:MAG: tRNA (cytidine(34)-2'-O)-methyltransferase [Deltaproteobacteria bacterium]|nr:tRNA (cytidine(34)-2'-O)-methyltransferase [Deltaproteobacteria bacterium]MBW2069483.1 tRNA (cytidine(34)-2'-O)-methyltransferase [Deltaproteobacteria bacterium]
MCRVVLYQPEIPQNTGNVARTCAATHTPLHLIEPLGFQLTDRYLRRAGLDYWPYVELHVHRTFSVFLEEIRPGRCVLFSTRGTVNYWDFSFRPDDCLVFGPETRGLPLELLEDERYPVVKIPLDKSRVRSLNLSTSVGIGLYEALRQLRLAPFDGC